MVIRRGQGTLGTLVGPGTYTHTTMPTAIVEEKHLLVKLLMYHPEMVFRIRIALVVLGIGISGGAILWRILAHGRTLYMIPDHMALRGLAVLMLFPLAGAALLPWNTCDFLDFQAASSLLFLIVGTIIAIRAHKKWYILTYAIEFILFGGLCPAS